MNIVLAIPTNVQIVRPAARCVCYKCSRRGHFEKVGRAENTKYDYPHSAAAVRQEKEQDSHLTTLSATSSSVGLKR